MFYDNVINSQSDVSSLKTSQGIGGDSTLSYINQMVVTPKTGTYYLSFVGESDFPLVSYTLKVYENDVYKPNPKGVHYQTGRDSTAFYDLIYNAYRYAIEEPGIIHGKPSVDLNQPNVDSRILSISVPYGVSVPSIKIEIYAKSNCKGILVWDVELES